MESLTLNFKASQIKDNKQWINGRLPTVRRQKFTFDLLKVNLSSHDKKGKLSKQGTLTMRQMKIHSPIENILLFSMTSLTFLTSAAQAPMEFEKYDPVSTLVVPHHETVKAKFPFVDLHSHHSNMDTQDLSELIAVMDAMNMKVIVNLSGASADKLAAAKKNIRDHYPNRFLLFANINFQNIGTKDWTERTVEQLRSDVKNGASGLKIFESLGTRVKDNLGKRVSVDDPRLDAIWEVCGELKIPVLIHTAAPKSFWSPIDEHNERWLELTKYPERVRNDSFPAPWQQLINEQHTMFLKHPKTTFIAAHLGWYGNDLQRLGSILDRIPNMYTEFGAVIAELGRQPKMAKKFLEKYQDRVLFGKDSWIPSEYKTYFRVLETEDEYFPYHKKYHAFWSLYGVGLSDDVLKKIYYKNALKLLPVIDKKLFPK